MHNIQCQNLNYINCCYKHDGSTYPTAAGESDTLLLSDTTYSSNTNSINDKTNQINNINYYPPVVTNNITPEVIPSIPVDNITTTNTLTNHIVPTKQNEVNKDFYYQWPNYNEQQTQQLPQTTPSQVQTVEPAVAVPNQIAYNYNTNNSQNNVQTNITYDYNYNSKCDYTNSIQSGTIPNIPNPTIHYPSKPTQTLNPTNYDYKYQWPSNVNQKNNYNSYQQQQIHQSSNGVGVIVPGTNTNGQVIQPQTNIHYNYDNRSVENSYNSSHHSHNQLHRLPQQNGRSVQALPTHQSINHPNLSYHHQLQQQPQQPQYQSQYSHVHQLPQIHKSRKSTNEFIHPHHPNYYHQYHQYHQRVDGSKMVQNSLYYNKEGALYTGKYPEPNPAHQNSIAVRNPFEYDDNCKKRKMIPPVSYDLYKKSQIELVNVNYEAYKKSRADPLNYEDSRKNLPINPNADWNDNNYMSSQNINSRLIPPNQQQMISNHRHMYNQQTIPPSNYQNNYYYESHHNANIPNHNPSLPIVHPQQQPIINTNEPYNYNHYQINNNIPQQQSINYLPQQQLQQPPHFSYENYNNSTNFDSIKETSVVCGQAIRDFISNWNDDEDEDIQLPLENMTETSVEQLTENIIKEEIIEEKHLPLYIKQTENLLLKDEKFNLEDLKMEDFESCIDKLNENIVIDKTLIKNISASNNNEKPNNSVEELRKVRRKQLEEQKQQQNLRKPRSNLLKAKLRKERCKIIRKIYKIKCFYTKYILPKNKFLYKRVPLSKRSSTSSASSSTTSSSSSASSNATTTNLMTIRYRKIIRRPNFADSRKIKKNYRRRLQQKSINSKRELIKTYRNNLVKNKNNENLHTKPENINNSNKNNTKDICSNEEKLEIEEAKVIKELNNEDKLEIEEAKVIQELNNEDKLKIEELKVIKELNNQNKLEIEKTKVIKEKNIEEKLEIEEAKVIKELNNEEKLEIEEAKIIKEKNIEEKLENEVIKEQNNNEQTEKNTERDLHNKESNIETKNECDIIKINDELIKNIENITIDNPCKENIELTCDITNQNKEDIENKQLNISEKQKEDHNKMNNEDHIEDHNKKNNEDHMQNHNKKTEKNLNDHMQDSNSNFNSETENNNINNNDSCNSKIQENIEIHKHDENDNSNKTKEKESSETRTENTNSSSKENEIDETKVENKIETNNIKKNNEIYQGEYHSFKIHPKKRRLTFEFFNEEFETQNNKFNKIDEVQKPTYDSQSSESQPEKINESQSSDSFGKSIEQRNENNTNQLNGWRKKVNENKSNDKNECEVKESKISENKINEKEETNNNHTDDSNIEINKENNNKNHKNYKAENTENIKSSENKKENSDRKNKNNIKQVNEISNKNEKINESNEKRFEFSLKEDSKEDKCERTLTNLKEFEHSREDKSNRTLTVRSSTPNDSEKSKKKKNIDEIDDEDNERNDCKNKHENKNGNETEYDSDEEKKKRNLFYNNECYNIYKKYLMEFETYESLQSDENTITDNDNLTLEDGDRTLEDEDITYDENLIEDNEKTVDDDDDDDDNMTDDINIFQEDKKDGGEEIKENIDDSNEIPSLIDLCEQFIINETIKSGCNLNVYLYEAYNYNNNNNELIDENGDLIIKNNTNEEFNYNDDDDDDNDKNDNISMEELKNHILTTINDRPINIHNDVDIDDNNFDHENLELLVNGKSIPPPSSPGGCGNQNQFLLNPDTLSIQQTDSPAHSDASLTCIHHEEIAPDNIQKFHLEKFAKDLRTKYLNKCNMKNYFISKLYKRYKWRTKVL